MTGQESSARWPAVVFGLDGKKYPGPQYRTRRVREYLFGRCHYERHENGLSCRQIIAVLAEEGFRISVGTVSAYLRKECIECSGGPNADT
jgi:hypothetical protein